MFDRLLEKLIKVTEDVSYLSDKDLISYRIGLERELKAGKDVKAELDDVYKELDKRGIPRTTTKMYTLRYKTMKILKGDNVIVEVPIEQLESTFGVSLKDIFMMDPSDVLHLLVKTKYPEADGWEIAPEREE